MFDNTPIRRFIHGVCCAYVANGCWDPNRDKYTDIGFRAGYHAFVHHHNDEAFMRDFMQFWFDYIQWRDNAAG